MMRGTAGLYHRPEIFRNSKRDDEPCTCLPIATDHWFLSMATLTLSARKMRISLKDFKESQYTKNRKASGLALALV